MMSEENLKNGELHGLSLVCLVQWVLYLDYVMALVNGADLVFVKTPLVDQWVKQEGLKLYFFQIHHWETKEIMVFLPKFLIKKVSF